MTEPRFVRCASVRLMEQRGDEWVVADALTDRRFLVSELVCRVLEDLRSPREIAEIGDRYPALEPAELREMLAVLERRALVTRQGAEPEDPTCRLRPVRPRLFRLPAHDEADEGARRVVIGIPFGRGNAASDASSRTPDRLRRLADDLQVDFRSPEATAHLCSLLELPAEVGQLAPLLTGGRAADAGNLSLYEHEPNQHVFDKITRLAREVLGRSHLPLFLGGDHSITHPILRAVQEREEVCVVQLDAHTDTYVKHMDEVYAGIATHHNGNFAARSMDLPGVKGFYQYGVRGMCNVGDLALHPKQLGLFTPGDVREMLAGRAPLGLPDGAPCYLTVDIDVLDPAIAPGTASPVPGGLSYHEFFALLSRLMAGRRIAGMDLVEIDGSRDAGERTLELGLRIVTAMLAWAEE